MKSTHYFPHDYNARNDPKIQNILMEMGADGFYIFWSLVEIMYEQDGKLLLSDCKGYAWQLRTTEEKVNQLINLAFEKDEKFFFSKSVLERLDLIKQKSEKARESASRRWEDDANALKDDANALRTHSNGNAINKSKVNKIKENESKVNEEIYIQPPEGKKRLLLEAITESDMETLSEKYQVPIPFVISCFDDLENYCLRTGRTYKNYFAALASFVKRSAVERKEKSNGKSKLTIITPDPAWQQAT